MHIVRAPFLCTVAFWTLLGSAQDAVFEASKDNSSRGNALPDMSASTSAPVVQTQSANSEGEKDFFDPAFDSFDNQSQLGLDQDERQFDVEPYEDAAFDQNMFADGGDMNSYKPEELKPNQLGKLHKTIDSDGDGRVSVSEMLHYLLQVEAKRTVDDGMKSCVSTDLQENFSQEDVIFEDEDYHFFEDEFGDFDNTSSRRGKKTPWRQTRIHLFQLADGDGDGKLNCSEQLVFSDRRMHTQKMLDYLVDEELKTKDKNGDGALSQDEYFPDAEWLDANESRHRFNIFDSDKDGLLTRKELRWLNLHGENNVDMSAIALDGLIQRVDSDGDGELSANEMMNATEALADDPITLDLMVYASHEIDSIAEPPHLSIAIVNVLPMLALAGIFCFFFRGRRKAKLKKSPKAGDVELQTSKA